MRVQVWLRVLIYAISRIGAGGQIKVPSAQSHSNTLFGHFDMEFVQRLLLCVPLGCLTDQFVYLLTKHCRVRDSPCV